MKKITYDGNTKFQMAYNAVQRAKGKRRERLLREALEVIRTISFVAQYNEKNADYVVKG